MNAQVAKLRAEQPADPANDNPLAKLREPFPPNLISKLPKETGAQAKQRKADQDQGKWPPKCSVCDGYHHPKAVHLDYVGHAALTDRLLDVDPHWTWEPMGYAPDGTPAFDKNGGLWIKLTVCGMTRIGYGNADGKSGGDAVKEIIGDALRNAAMRFGAALDLWHKGDLHAEEEAPVPSAEEQAVNHLRSCAVDPDVFKEAWLKNKDAWKNVLGNDAYARLVAEMKRLGAQVAEKAKAAAEPPPPPPPPADDFGISEDEIPY